MSNDLPSGTPSRAPKISICIPAYRGGRFIGAAIESVLAQTETDFELVIVDDCSSDDTAALVAAFTDERIRFIQNEQTLGAEANWNRCLTEARGRYIKLLPQDDLLAPDCLAAQATVLDADDGEQIALVFGWRTIVDERGKPMMTRRGPRGLIGRVSGAELLRQCVRAGTNLIGEPGGVLFRRATARQVGPFDASIPYLIDLDYWARLLAHGDGLAIPHSLSSFRISAESWSVAIRGRQAGEFRAFISRISARQDIPLTTSDIAIGRCMAALNCVGRLAIYGWMLPRWRVKQQPATDGARRWKTVS
jgi:glycosyltransferase involved in cell wall biosynthesis